MLLLGMALSIPASLLAGLAPIDDFLFFARVARRGRRRHGLSDDAGADHRALVGRRRGPSRSRSGRRSAARSPRSARCLAGALLEDFEWGSVFSSRCRWRSSRSSSPGARPGPRQRDDRPGRQPRRHPLDRCWSAPLVLAINFAPVPARGRWRSGSASSRRRGRGASSSASAARRPRSTTSTSPRGASSGSRRCAGIIVFGSLMGAMFIGQQFLQNVLGYSTLEAGAAILPAAVAMVIVAPRSAKLVEAHGARFTLLLGYVFCCSASSRCCCSGRRASPTGRSGSPTR